MIKKFLKYRRFGLVSLFPIVMFIYGIPGYIDDGQAWIRGLAIINPDWQGWGYLLALFLGAVFLCAVVPQRVLNWFMNHEPKKIYTERTAGEIFSEVAKLTDMEMKRFAQPHLGKWIRVQSVVTDIMCDDNFFCVDIGGKLGPYARLRFVKERWPSIETMRRGDRLAAEGKIKEIGLMVMYMDCCERVELRDEDDSFR